METSRRRHCMVCQTLSTCLIRSYLNFSPYFKHGSWSLRLFVGFGWYRQHCSSECLLLSYGVLFIVWKMVSKCGFKYLFFMQYLVKQKYLLFLLSINICCHPGLGLGEVHPHTFFQATPGLPLRLRFPFHSLFLSLSLCTSMQLLTSTSIQSALIGSRHMRSFPSWSSLLIAVFLLRRLYDHCIWFVHTECHGYHEESHECRDISCFLWKRNRIPYSFR